MKKSTKQFIIIAVLFALLLLIPLASALISERSAALDIEAQGGVYDPVLPMHCGPSDGVSSADLPPSVSDLPVGN